MDAAQTTDVPTPFPRDLSVAREKRWNETSRDSEDRILKNQRWESGTLGGHQTIDEGGKIGGAPIPMDGAPQPYFGVTIPLM